MHEGDVAYLADGAIRLRVDDVRDGEVLTEVEVGGTLASRQGLSLPNVTTSLPAVSEDDLRLIDAGVEMGVDLLALSFVRRREDLEPVKERLSAHGRDIPVIAKIEKPQAAANAEEIIRAADGIMVARGDLGIELRIEEVPLVQKRLLQLAGKHAKPAITATQMLESMVHSSRPTRAERTDVVRRLSLQWGVRAELNEEPSETFDLLEECAEAAKRGGMVAPGDRIGITAGLPAGKAGGTNLFKVHLVE